MQHPPCRKFSTVGLPLQPGDRPDLKEVSVKANRRLRYVQRIINDCLIGLETLDALHRGAIGNGDPVPQQGRSWELPVAWAVHRKQAGQNRI